MVLWQIAPRCTRTQNPEDAIEHTTVIQPPNATGLFGSIGLIVVHS
jgi:hypothetical protein